MASASTTPTSGTTATDGTTRGTIPGTAGMHPTIATATIAGTTGAGAGTTTDGTTPGTMAATTEAIITATTAGITGTVIQDVVKAQPVTISDHVIALTVGVPEAAD